MGCVYQAKNKINGMLYIGKTIKNFGQRIREHKCQALTYNSNYYFHNALKKYGFENFEWSILKESDDNNILLDFEKYYIKQLNTKISNGYNMTDGGEGTVGYKPTKEARLQRSINYKGKPHPPHSKETKEKISMSHKGRKHSPEHCENMRKYRLGLKSSEETKRKISEGGFKRWADIRNKNASFPEDMEEINVCLN